MTHDDLGPLLKQAGDRFTMSTDLPRELRRKVAVRRIAAAGALGLVLIGAGAGGVFAVSSFDESNSSPPAEDGKEDVESDAPAVGRVVCTESGTHAATPDVRASEDGIHILIDNRTDKRAFYIRDEDLSDGNHGGRLAPHSVEEVVSTFPPGQILVGCFADSRSAPYSEVADQGFAELTVVDPESLWTPAEPACPVAERIKWETPVEAIWEESDYEGVARMHLDLFEEDGFRPAGYRETPWKIGPTYSVIREDRVIAIVSFPTGGSAMFVQTCAEGGLEPDEEDDPQSMGDSDSWVFYTDSDGRFSIGYPETWYRARESLTPELAEPAELVSIATFDPIYREGECAHMPSSALEDIGPRDAFVSIQEGGGGNIEAYRPRPEDFEENAKPSENFMCTPADVELYWLNFRDSARAFYAIVALGSDVAPDTRSSAWDVLNSFEPEPAEG